MKSERILKWLESAGGPLLLLEEHLLTDWRGVFAESNQIPTSGYDRACNIDDYIGIIEVGSGYGIVLGDEPFLTAWSQLPDPQKSFLIRWVFAENEAAVIEALTNLQELKWENTEVEIKLSGDKLVLFDAACDGSQIDDRLEIEIPKGSYTVETFHYKPNNQTSLILHRFNSV
jgi:hypothetical protein